MKEGTAVAEITQLVDDRIQQIRREKAELDEIRERLERKEFELNARERALAEDVLPLNERKETLEKQINEAKAELNAIRTERYASIETFGEELDQLHMDKSSESVSMIKNLQQEIAFMLKGKAELEDEISETKKELADLEKQRERAESRLIDEKETYVTRIRAEREASLREINLEHSMAVAELDKTKKVLIAEISDMEQTKAIEWNKVQAEVSRYKTTQMADVDSQKEQMLADAEKERAGILNGLFDEEKKSRDEIAAKRRQWEDEILGYEAKKQTVIDEIKLLEYEYDKTRSENIVKQEKIRVEELRLLDEQRAGAIARQGEELEAQIDEHKKVINGLRVQHQEEKNAMQLEITEMETKKAAILGEIDVLMVKHEKVRAEIEVDMEILKSDKLKEIDELRLQRLKEVEDLRQARINDLEEVYISRVASLENMRNERLETCNQAVDRVEGELEALKEARKILEDQINILRDEYSRVSEETQAELAKEQLDRQIEIEKLTTEKIAEVENVCAGRLKQIEEREKRHQEEFRVVEVSLRERSAALAEEQAKVRQQLDNLEAQFCLQRDEQLAEIQKKSLETMEELSRIKLDKIREIDDDLGKYRTDRLESIHAELEHQRDINLKSLEQLAELNNDYNKRMGELQEQQLLLESEKRAVEFKDMSSQKEIEEHKKLMNELNESHRKELDLLTEAKNQQIDMLTQQLQRVADLEAENNSLSVRLAMTGNTNSEE